MQESIVPKRKVSPLILVVGGIVLASGMILLIPSSRTTRVIKAKNLLATEYAGPKDISYLYDGYLVTHDNKEEKISPSDIANITVFAPNPTEVVSMNFVVQFANQYYAPGDKTKTVCFLAPDATSTGWSLFAKVWIGETLRHKSTQILQSYAQTMLSSPASATTSLTKLWTDLPPEIQAESQAVLEQNREILKAHKGSCTYYQDGKGTNYLIDLKHNTWEVRSLLAQAYPDR